MSSVRITFTERTVVSSLNRRQLFEKIDLLLEQSLVGQRRVIMQNLDRDWTNIATSAALPSLVDLGELATANQHWNARPVGLRLRQDVVADVGLNRQRLRQSRADGSRRHR